MNFVSLESQCFPRLRLGKQNSLFPSGPVNKCLLLSLQGGKVILVNLHHLIPHFSVLLSICYSTTVSLHANLSYYLSQYLLVDTLHNLMFSTIDDFATVISVSLSFSPDEILYHPSSSNVVLAYDESASKVRIHAHGRFPLH